MSTGQRAETYNVTAPKQSNTIQSFAARNLPEDVLGGIIFPCTQKTIEECLSKQLFGLPICHFSYVKNIKPGLPLFLFNFTNREMLGIFEAATHGQLAIDKFAWSHDGRTKTYYPAQVRFYTKTKCLPLRENRYRSVILSNYHKLRHFFFELDHAQTRSLVSLFVPAPVCAFPNKQNLSGPPSPVEVGNQFAVGSTSGSRPEESPPGVTFAKDLSSASLGGNAPVKDSTSFEQRTGNDELLLIINELPKKTEAIAKKQIESDAEILVLRETVKDMERKIQEVQQECRKLHATLTLN